MNKTMKVREAARISAPKMGEFVDASDARRKTILRDQKFWTSGKRLVYHDAELVMRAALFSSDVSALLSVGAKGLKGKTVTSEPARIARDCSIEAITRFRALYGTLDLTGVETLMSPVAGYHLAIEDVDVSVRPLVRLKRENAAGVQYGGLLLVLRKEEGLSDSAGKCVAELQRLALVDAFPAGSKIDRSLCIVLDVFHGSVWTAPKHGRKLMKEVRDVCWTIARLWPSSRWVKQRRSYEVAGSDGRVTIPRTVLSCARYGWSSPTSSEAQVDCRMGSRTRGRELSRTG